MPHVRGWLCQGRSPPSSAPTRRCRPSSGCVCAAVSKLCLHCHTSGAAGAYAAVSRLFVYDHTFGAAGACAAVSKLCVYCHASCEAGACAAVTKTSSVFAAEMRGVLPVGSQAAGVRVLQQIQTVCLLQACWLQVGSQKHLHVPWPPLLSLYAALPLRITILCL